MGSTQGPEAGNIESAVLHLSRHPQDLAALLHLFLPGSKLNELARLVARKRVGKSSPVEILAFAVIENPPKRKAIVQELLKHAPKEDSTGYPDPDQAPDWLPWVRSQTLAVLIWQDLNSQDQKKWTRAQERLQKWADWLEPAAEPALRPRSAPTASSGTEQAPRKPQPSELQALQQENRSLQERMKQNRNEVSRLQNQLGQEYRRQEQLREDLEEFRAQKQEALQRAAELKKRLESSNAASVRETELSEELEHLRHEVHILQQKFAILDEERDDLHAVLQDYDRFSNLREEEVPSFRDRPLQPEENALAERLLERKELRQQSFRVLVVGGGEPQHRHHSKLEEYAEAMHFASFWRMAEYTAWHKEIAALAADMEHRYDALVILHWNRTTFTRKAREICNRAGQKPCVTCHYEGFISLRQSLQKCLRQLLDG